MKHLLLLATLMCLGSIPCLAQDSPSDVRQELPEYRVFGEAASAGDEEAIAEVMGRLGEAWGSSDPTGVAEVYAADAEWTNAFGVVVRGREALGDYLGWLFAQDSDTISAAESASYRRVSLRYVGKDVAIVHGVTRSNRSGARSGEGERRVHNTYVLAKKGDDWRIVHHMIMDARE